MNISTYPSDSSHSPELPFLERSLKSGIKVFWYVNMVPNKFKSLVSVEDFKKHIKDWKPTTYGCKL